MRLPQQPAGARGFTIVELLVAMALVIFIMAILSEAFVAALESFYRLKAVGDMDVKLRTSTTILRRDLAAARCVDSTGQPQPLSAIHLDSDGPPTEGFFRIAQYCTTLTPPAVSIDEGTDPDTIPSARATSQTLAFSVFLGAQRPSVPSTLLNRRENYLIATVGDSTYPSPLELVTPAAYRDDPSWTEPRPHAFYSQWGEVAYFLRQTGTNTSGTTPLFGLYRRQKLALDRLDQTSPSFHSRLDDPASASPPRVSQSNQARFYYDVSCAPDPNRPAYLYFNNPTDLTIPQRRFGMDARTTSAGIPLTGPPSPSLPPPPLPSGIRQYPIITEPPIGEAASLLGADLLLNDVISFQVKILVPAFNPSDFVDLSEFHGPPQALINSVYTAANLLVFDTWSKQTLGTLNPYDYSGWATPGSDKTIPLRVTVTAIQITIRVWDRRTEQTRQITLVQDMMP